MHQLGLIVFLTEHTEPRSTEPLQVAPPKRLTAVDLFVQVFGASRSGEVMIVSVPFAFQVHSLQGLVKLETELARRTGCRTQVKQLINRKSFALAQVEILRIQMLALVQRYFFPEQRAGSCPGEQMRS